MKTSNAEIGDSIFCMWSKKDVEKVLSLARDKIAKDLGIIDETYLLFVGLLITQCMKLMKKLAKLNSATTLFHHKEI